MTDYTNKNNYARASHESRIQQISDIFDDSYTTYDYEPEGQNSERTVRRSTQGSSASQSAAGATRSLGTPGRSSSSERGSSGRTAASRSSAAAGRAGAPRTGSSAKRSHSSQNASSGRPSVSAARSRNSTSGRSFRKRKKKFKKLLLLYIAVLVLILIVGSIFFSIYLASYENGQPTHLAESIVKSYASQQGIIDFVKENADKTSLMGDVDNVAQIYATNIAGKKISYKENSNFRPDSPSYDITADGSTVAKVTLSSAGTGSFGSTKWQIGSINITDYLPDTMTVTVNAPAGSTVTVNGSVLDSSYISSTGVPEILEGSLKFIADPPQYDAYKLSGLLSDPQVTVTDASGNALQLTQTEDGYFASVDDPSFVASVEDRVYEAITNYATYFIHMSYGLANYIVYDSELYYSIFGGGPDDMQPIDTNLYMWEWIDDYNFTERSAENFVKYTDDCFTVDVKYALDMSFTDPTYSDENQKMDATWVFVIEPLDGSWCISEIINH